MSADAITLTDINSADWSLKLSDIGGVVQGLDDVQQCIAIILRTPQGSDPLRPTFGANLWSYIDSSISAAIPSIVREVTAAITMWEPRVIVESVAVSPANDNTSQAGAHLNIATTWRLKLSSTPATTTTVTISGGK